jgi:DNA-binding winged helix-turn-helix (wHTH) protein
MAVGRWDDAAQNFMHAAAECRRRGDCVMEPFLLPWVIEALVRAGRLQAAHAELERAAAQPHLLDESTTAKLLYPRALLARAEGRQADSARSLEQLAQTPAAPALFRHLGKELSRTPGAVDEVRRPVARAHDILRRQFRFGSCLLDVERREFWVDGRLSALAPKPFEVLVYLHRNRHRLVPQEELLDALWPDGSGSPECLAQAIAKIRQAARTGGGTTPLVLTVYGRGYRLVADARGAEEEADLSLRKLADVPDRPRLALLPLLTVDGRATASAVTAYRLSLIGHSLALHARMTLLPPGAIEPCITGIDTPSPEALVAAVRARRPEACAVHVGLSGDGDTLQLDYLAEAAGVHLRGTLKGVSPTSLGRALAVKLLRHLGRTDADAPVAEHDPWVLQLLELASLAAKQGRPQGAARILDVILDDDPDNRLVRELQAEVTQSLKASAA